MDDSSSKGFFSMKAIAQELENIIKSDKSICEWNHLDVHWQERIAKAISPETQPNLILYPSSSDELAEAIRFAYRNNWGILPCGSGSKLSWGGVVEDINLVISTERLNRLLEHAVGDLTVTVEAGMKFADVQKILAASNQFLALDPAYPQDATIGGIIATADTGSWRQRYGGVRDMLLGLSFVRADGAIAKAGGRVVKNVAGYDLMKLFTGSYGTLGMISQVTLRVYPLPAASRTVVLTGEAQPLATATKTLLASALTPTVVDLISPQITANLGISKDISLVVRFQSVPESVEEQSERLLDVGKQLSLQGVIYSDTEEVDFVEKLQTSIWETPHSTQQGAILCKIGVRPSEAVTILHQLYTLAPDSSRGLIHAGSGLGLLHLQEPETILKMRQYCQAQGGFLTVLEAPLSIKQELDVWGYIGNALNLMRKIKEQFDPQNRLNPNRFFS